MQIKKYKITIYGTGDVISIYADTNELIKNFDYEVSWWDCRV